MDLLSARKTFRRSDRTESHTPTGPAETSLGNGNWFNRQTIQVPPASSYSDNQYPPRVSDIESNNHSGPMPMQIPIAEMLNDPTWGQEQMSTNPDTGLGNMGDFDVNAVSTSSTWEEYG
jgi:hypothetical protein